MRKFCAGELTKIKDGCYGIVVGEKGNSDIEIFTLLSGRTSENCSGDNLQKIEQLTPKEEQIRQELVDKYNKYMREKVEKHNSK